MQATIPVHSCSDAILLHITYVPHAWLFTNTSPAFEAAGIPESSLPPYLQRSPPSPPTHKLLGPLIEERAKGEATVAPASAPSAASAASSD